MKLIRNFILYFCDTEIVEKRILTEFGYKIGQEIIKYDIISYTESEPIKWGFIGEKITFL